MLLLLLILLFLVFGGLGFVLHLLWIGAVVFLAVAVFHALTRNRSTT